MSQRTKVTLPQLQAKAAGGEPITWLTCYARGSRPPGSR